MPRRLSLPLALVVALPLVAREGKPEDAVSRAIEAAGGAELLNRYPAGRVSAKGVIHAGTDEVPLTVEQVYHVPGRSRTVVRMEAKGQKQEVLHVVNGTKVRYAINGTPVPTTDAAAKELQATTLLLEVGRLTPLIADRKFVLRPDRAAKGDGAGVVVQVKGYPDLRLGFDRVTGHLVRLSRRAIDPDSGKEVELEQAFSEFKPVAGLTRPTRVVVSKDGQKLLDLSTVSFIPLERVEPREFVTDN